MRRTKIIWWSICAAFFYWLWIHADFIKIPDKEGLCVNNYCVGDRSGDSHFYSIVKYDDGSTSEENEWLEVGKRYYIQQPWELRWRSENLNAFGIYNDK